MTNSQYFPGMLLKCVASIRKIFIACQQDSATDTDDAILGTLTWAPMGKCRFWGITSPKPMTEMLNFGKGYSLLFHANKYQNKISLTNLNNF